MSRYFTLILKSRRFAGNTPEVLGVTIEKTFSEHLGYRLLHSSEGQWAWEKGSKWATYIGLVNWQILYRRVVVELADHGALKLTYHFSWLTNVAILAAAAREELGYLKRAFQADELKMERLR